MKKAQAQGYLLEEILAYLIRTSGYELITKPSPNDPDLSIDHNGLNLKGRGANHQIDVLGELRWIPSFSFPLRLIVEAKFRNKITGIEVIRNSVGILADVNQNYFVVKNTEPKPRYHYTSVIFSTSGFSDPAVDMAIAHQVQLADLSNTEYDELKNRISVFIDSIFGGSDQISKSEFRRIRENLREKLASQDNILINDTTNIAFKNLINFIKTDKQGLFIGMSQGGFMLLLKANDPNNFIDFAKEHNTHKVGIRWNVADNGARWTITPLDGHNYEFTFKLPEKLHDWIFKLSANPFDEALNQKVQNFSRISIYYHDKQEGKDYIFNLEFDKYSLREGEVGANYIGD